MHGGTLRLQRAALSFLQQEGLPFQEFDSSEGTRRYPQICWEGVRGAVLEEEAGYLLARFACQTVLEMFLAVDQKQQMHITGTMTNLLFCGLMMKMEFIRCLMVKFQNQTGNINNYLYGILIAVIGAIIVKLRSVIICDSAQPPPTQLGL